jgi:hypothetical protein
VKGSARVVRCFFLLIVFWFSSSCSDTVPAAAAAAVVSYSVGSLLLLNVRPGMTFSHFKNANLQV